MIVYVKELLFLCFMMTLGSLTFAYAQNAFVSATGIIIGVWMVPFVLFATGSVKIRRKGEIL